MKYKASEDSIRRRVNKKMLAEGYLLCSVHARFFPNWPDTIVFLPSGEVLLIEYKAKFFNADRKITNGQYTHAQRIVNNYKHKVFFVSGERYIFNAFNLELPSFLRKLIDTDGFKEIREIPYKLGVAMDIYY